MPIAAMPLLVAVVAGVGTPIPTRTPVGSFPIQPAKPVTRVETMRVDFAPGQVMPRHMHPVPVVCFVAEGRFAVSIGHGPEQLVGKGETTLEPAGQVVHYFRNLSRSRSAELYCAVLAGTDDHQYSVMLEK